MSKKVNRTLNLLYSSFSRLQSVTQIYLHDHRDEISLRFDLIFYCATYECNSDAHFFILSFQV